MQYSLAISILAFTTLAGAAQGQELEFATAARARGLLSTKDAYIERMSPLDRSVRMKTDRLVTEAEYLELAASATLDWEDWEKEAIGSAYQKIEPTLKALRLPLPPRLFVVKTTGREEGGSWYTRQTAVIVPRAELRRPTSYLQKVLAHELFHVASRAHPKLAERLYAAIGFRECGEPDYQTRLLERRITNPDAPYNNYCIRVVLDGQSIDATPILFFGLEIHTRPRGGKWHEYLRRGLLLRTRPGEPTAERIVQPKQVVGYFEQVGHNTSNVDHPEEIVAENFALLVMGQPVRSPAVLENLRRALSEFARGPASPPTEQPDNR